MPKSSKKTGKENSNLRVRGNEFVGRVVSAKAPKTATVLRELTVYVPKFERYKKVRSKIHAHNPERISAKEDDLVKIGETRKISKTKSFVITEIVGHTRHAQTREEMKEEKKKKSKAEEEKETTAEPVKKIKEEPKAEEKTETVAEEKAEETQ
jgi:small subunit ribosomal protein S17